MSEILSLVALPVPLEGIGLGIRAVSGSGCFWIRFEGNQTLESRGAGSMNRWIGRNVTLGGAVNRDECRMVDVE